MGAARCFFLRVRLLLLLLLVSEAAAMLHSDPRLLSLSCGDSPNAVDAGSGTKVSLSARVALLVVALVLSVVCGSSVASSASAASTSAWA